MADRIRSERMGDKMKKMVSVMILGFLFLWAPVLSAFDAPDRMNGWAKTYKLSILNKSEVKNPKGEILGQIEDFVMDPQRARIALVILSHVGVAGMGQKVKIIPYEFLSFDERICFPRWK